MDLLLGPLPARRDLHRMPQVAGTNKIKLHVDRTLPFEFIAGVLPPFLRLWDADETIALSPYDASLSSIGGSTDADVYILWLDWRLYRDTMTVQAAGDWLKERIAALRSKTDKPVLVNNWPETYEMEDKLFSARTGKRRWIRQLNELLSCLSEEITDFWVIDLAYIALELDGAFFDSRNEQVSNYPFSDQATIAAARHLGLHLLPAVLRPRIKAVALDLDDTLYSGVLGEDGIEGVTLSEAHARLQNLLLRLKQSGLMLTICSRNEEKDVQELFQKRSDFPLKWHDFAAVCADWNPKADHLRKLARQLNIDPSAILFIDDNPAELLKAANQVPAVRLLKADPKGELTLVKICNYPGLYQLRQDDSALLRTADIQANRLREELKSQASDYMSYLESLQMTVRIYTNEKSHMNRVFEMSHKTNQFNLALRRMSMAEVEQALNDSGYLTFTVQLSDILSDSGIIGTFICRLENENAALLEMLFSCRALGREIETIAFSRLLRRLMTLGVRKMRIDVQEGPRNAPARDWLQRFVNQPESEQDIADLLARVSAACASYPVTVEEMT
jgi:FkbH-like protein